jgi:predicted CoA-substrate-specific enzyme activase
MRIGVDAGTKFLKIVYTDYSGSIIPHTYCQHFGNPEKEIKRILNTNGFQNIESIVFSGAHANQLASAYDNAGTSDEISAIIEILNYLKNKCKYIINVGAGSIKLIELDEKGNFASYSENSLCAAGTGSFLDEQMHRMNFTYADIASIPFIKDVPDVATRCAVFAKSDLIHRQQEGYSKEEMWSGLCRGVSATMLQSVFKGNIPTEDILFCGGMFLNPIVRIWIKGIVQNPFFNDNGHFFPAMGSLILNGKNKNKSIFYNKKDKKDKLKILETKLSKSVDFAAKEEYFSDDLEIRIHKELNDYLLVSIGIDIGSTSTKLVVIEADSRDVLIDIYGRTKGNPVEATKKLFDELKKIAGNRKLAVVSTATTGSGRKLVGKIIGADAIINEITSHFKGASFFTPSIETIFEIGGQDSKYIRGHNGNVVDCNMNFVCAAGTGSFIEEQVQRLGFDIREIGDLVLGLSTPHTSDRCTVFMEQDINKLLRDGFSREEVLAGVISSIAKNYLNRVVGTRPVTGEKIFFQGATARNMGIVAAFESILHREIVVSPFCHVMGAFGAALISLDRIEAKSKFRGMDIFDQKIELEYGKCDKCANLCTITEVRLGSGIREYWGFMCGKETIEEKKRTANVDYFKSNSDLINTYIKNKAYKNKSILKNKIRAGIPNVLSMHSHIVLWNSFLKELGFDIVLSGKSSRKLKEEGVRLSKSEFCFPVKLSLAHMKELAESEDADILFFPATLSEKKQDNSMPRMLCPYVISYPSIAMETMHLNKEIISPVIDFRQKPDVTIDELYNKFKRFNISRHDVLKAYNNALVQHNKYLKEKYEYGLKLLQVFKNPDKIGIICIGRPYNLFDKIINLGLTERLNNNEVIVFPYDFLINPDENNSEIPHMYWNYGEKILSISKKIKNYNNIYPVYFTNFSCGPDSFVLSRFEDIMRGKPYLIIELDEHGSETGYLTRIEAFMDVILEKKREKSSPDKPVKSFSKSWKAYEKKIWFPPMFEIVPRFFAAAFRAFGFDAEALPVEDNFAFELGKNNTRGSECLPACITIGGFLKKLKETEADPSMHALFMPTAEGPCRFGQYSTLHKSILMKNGMGDAEIFSPTSANSYMGMKGPLTRYLLDVIMSSDILSKRVYNIRPYELNKGETDNIVEKIVLELESGIEKKCNLVKMTAQALNKLSDIPVTFEKKPLVGIVGEIYVRSNLFCNNNVIRHIEAAGGEAWLSPMSEWVIYTAWMERYFNRVNRPGLLKKLGINIKTSYMINRMHSFEHALQEHITGRTEPPIERVLEAGKRYVPIEFEGEVILTIGRTIVFLEDGASMVVNCAPFGCMPGNITTSIFHNIQKKYNKPVINLFYDGESDVNRIISIYLSNLKTQPVVLDTKGKQHFSLTNSIEF